MKWLQRLLHRRRLERQLQAELQDHLERQISDNLRAGMSGEEARRSAYLRFGGLEQIREDCRDARGTHWLDAIYQDIRFACRTLVKSPGFTIAAVCTLALGIGANTAIFSIINGVILRPLPYREPSRLVAVQEQLRTSSEDYAFSYPDFLDCSRASHSFQAIAAWRNSGLNVSAPGEPEYMRARQVSAGFLSVLGVNPILGRDFLPEEDRRGADPVAIIGYSLWQERFHRDAKSIGARLVADGKGYTIVGILPASFYFQGDVQVLTPIGQNDTIATQKRDMYSGIEAIARLKPGVTVQQANSELKAIGLQLAREYPDTNRDMTFGTKPLKQQVIGDVGSTLSLLAGAVALVLLIACANVANLFLARSLSRAREFAIRAALGAGRGRLIRQLLTESVLLALIGGVLGLGIATAAWTAALRYLPEWLPRTRDILLDGRVLLFTLAASVVTGIVFGLVPAIRQQFDLGSGLRQGTRGTTSRGIRRLQGSFVVAELSLALVLLTGAGLMMRTILRLWAVNPGFDIHHLLVMKVGLSPKVTGNPELMRIAWNQILERIRNTPGVEAVALDSLIPLSENNQSITYWTGSETVPPKNAPQAETYTPTPGYLRAMKIPLLRGRFFTGQDRVGNQPVIVIDQTLAKRAFPGKDPVGSEMSIQLMGRVRIIGVVGAIKHQTLDEDADGPPQPALYVPFLQFPDEFMKLAQNGMNLLVRTSGSPAPVIQAVKQSVLGPTRDQPVRDVATMEQIIATSLAKRRGMLILLGLFAGIALLLASVGMYGVISYSMSRRVQEIGVRMALGAQPAQVRNLIVRQGMAMVLTGIVVGAAASLALARLLSNLLYGVSPSDPVTFAAVVFTLAGVAFAAIYIPARRAVRIDPVVALRYE